MPSELGDRYYLRPAAAFVRGLLAGSRSETDADCVARGLGAGVGLHHFKRGALPRVRRVLGMLEGLGITSRRSAGGPEPMPSPCPTSGALPPGLRLAPTSLLDVGCGRGAFIWPLLDRLHGLQQLITLELSGHRLDPLLVARRGGLNQIVPLAGDVTAVPLAENSVQTVTILEVLEHLQRPALAVREVLRVAREQVIASVPSKPDDNPQHIQLFDGEALSRLFLDAGARKVQLDYVLNHIVLLAFA